MDRPQITIEVEERLLAKVDDLVKSGVYKTRDEAISVGIAGLRSPLSEEDRRRIQQADIDGYTRFPQTQAELEWFQISTEYMIRAEPWEK